MSKTYLLIPLVGSVDSVRAINAHALHAFALDEFIELLQRGEAELIVVEEIEDE